MHLYFITRGIKHDVDRFINDLQAQYSYAEWKQGEGKPNITGVYQWGVRPVQLWEVVVRKEDMDDVLKCIPIAAESKREDLLLTPLRKALKAKKIDRKRADEIRKPENPRRIFCTKNVACHLIGTKDDAVNEDGNEML